jgi:diguanylate cyclase (GGDEF)-like protein
MVKDVSEELKRLRRDFLEMERVNRDEKDSLIKIINTFGAVVATHPEMTEECEAIRRFLSADKPLPLDPVETEIRKLKDKIIAKEQKPTPTSGILEEVQALREGLLDSRKIIGNIMLSLLEDFYPLTGEVASKAASVTFNVKEGKEGVALKETEGAFLGFLKSLKAKIQEDFRYVNSSFLALLNHVKELEGSLTQDFGGEERLKEIEYFDMKVNDEVGSIAGSFNLYTTITEIRSAVIEKIDNIKRIITLRKEEEITKLHSAQENIRKLKERITEAEREAIEMAKKAQAFQTEAMKDGLTGVYNRKAFDVKVNQALETMSKGGPSFSLVLFDVDKFKSINDTFGHVAGDKVLQKVAQSLQETFRKGDFIARFGGDEFAVVIEGMTGDMGEERISNFKKNLGKRRFTSYKMGDITVNVSAGIAPALESDTPEGLLDRADKALYASKQQRS